MDSRESGPADLLLAGLQEQPDSEVPLDIRTAAKAASLLDRNEQSMSTWLPLICERLEARNAPKAKGLSRRPDVLRV